MFISGTLLVFLAASSLARDWNVSPPLRNLRRFKLEAPYQNTTIASIHSASFEASTSTSLFPDPISETKADPPPANAPPSGFTTNTGVPPVPTPWFPNITSKEPTCLGVVTYTGSVPPTVFLTVTEPFEVTVTANASITTTAYETLITPPFPCETTIVPLFSMAPLLAPVRPPPALDPAPASAPAPAPSPAPASAPAAATSSSSGNKISPGSPRFSPDVATFPGARPPSQTPEIPDKASTEAIPSQTATDAKTFSATVVYSSIAYTSTVIVTKKTPVTVVVPPTSSPPVDFHDGPPKTPTGGGKPTSVPGSGGPSNGHGADQPTTTDGSNLQPPQNGAGQPPYSGPNRPSSTRPLGDSLNTLIISGPNPQTTPPRTTTVAGVPIIILPSSVVIGSSSYAVPTAGSTSVRINGVDFGLGPSEVVAPTATITLAPGRQGSGENVISPQPSSTVVTANGLTFTVGSTLAILSGTTYRIGQGAPSTSVIVGGATVSIGPNGLGLPSTNVSPASATRANGYIVYSTHGITFSINQSQAVVGGTTYRIGPNAPATSTVIGGETVSFGPNGVGLASTTLSPTNPPSSTDSSALRSTSTGTAQQTSTSDNSSPRTLRIPFSEALAWYLFPATIYWSTFALAL